MDSKVPLCTLMQRGRQSCITFHHGVEERAQHAALGGASAESEGGGEVRARFYSLWAVRKNLFDPSADGGREVQQFINQDVRMIVLNAELESM